MMTETALLLWMRGPALRGAIIIFLIGVMVRLLETLFLGRKPDYAEARGSAVTGGLRTIFTRFIPDPGTWQRAPVVVIAGYLFHIGFFIVVFLFAPHILLFKDMLGIHWPALPTPIIDAVTLITLMALLALLIHRLYNPVRRFLSRFQDYLVWLLTALPLITGYCALHRIGLPPSLLIALHLMSVEVLLVVFPFTHLMHAFTLFMARYYNGAVAGYRGVNS
jgi:nitrate reductase gamma subunit